MLLFLLFSSPDRVRFPITSQNLVKLCLLFGFFVSINQTNAYRKCWVKFINTHKMVFDLQLGLLHLSVWKKSASKMYRNSSTWNYNTIFNTLDASSIKSVLPPLCRWKPKHTKKTKNVFCRKRFVKKNYITISVVYSTTTNSHRQMERKDKRVQTATY